VYGYPTGQAAPTRTVGDRAIWKPIDGTWKDWIKCQGMSCDAWERKQVKRQKLNQLLGIRNAAPAVTTTKPASGSELLGGPQKVSYQTLYVGL